MRANAVNAEAVFLVEPNGAFVRDAYLQRHHIGAPADRLVQQPQQQCLAETATAIGQIDPDRRDMRFVIELPHPGKAGDRLWRGRRRRIAAVNESNPSARNPRQFSAKSSTNRSRDCIVCASEPRNTM